MCYEYIITADISPTPREGLSGAGYFHSGRKIEEKDIEYPIKSMIGVYIFANPLFPFILRCFCAVMPVEPASLLEIIGI